MRTAGAGTGTGAGAAAAGKITPGTRAAGVGGQGRLAGARSGASGARGGASGGASGAGSGASGAGGSALGKKQTSPVHLLASVASRLSFAASSGSSGSSLDMPSIAWANARRPTAAPPAGAIAAAASGRAKAVPCRVGGVKKVSAPADPYSIVVGIPCDGPVDNPVFRSTGALKTFMSSIAAPADYFVHARVQLTSEQWQAISKFLTGKFVDWNVLNKELALDAPTRV